MKRTTKIQPILNSEYPFPVYRSDVIKVLPNREYRLIITLNSCAENSLITPTITLPGKHGKLVYRNEEFTYMLSTCNSKEHPISELTAITHSGYFDVSYHCQITDYRKVPYWGSSKVLRPLGMERTIISSNSIRYNCTDMSGMGFNHYVFTVEWLEL